MVVDLRGQHQFVRLGLGDDRLQPLFDGVGGANHGIGQRVLHARRSMGDQWASMLSTGGGKGPGVPRRRLMNCCCSDVMRRRASASVSAANTLTPTMA